MSLPTPRHVFSTAVALAAIACSSVVFAGTVVFGNLGASGTGGLGINAVDVGPSMAMYVAQGFTAASPNLSVTSVSLGLSNVDSLSVVSVGLYADDAGKPASSPLYTSNNVLNVSAQALYTFNFTGADLTNGSKYWVIPQSDFVTWQGNSNNSAPVGQNSSGYTFANTLLGFDDGSWRVMSSKDFAVSVEAVPEPSTYAMAGIGMGAAGLLRWRSRRKRA